MNETEVLNEFFIWEEKNSTEPTPKSGNNGVNDHKDIINETKTNSMPNDWKDIIDPKLRKKMRLKEKYKRYREKHKDKIKLKKKIYRKANKDKIKARHKAWREVNKDRLKVQYTAYNKSNKDKQKAWREANRDKLRVKRKFYIETNKQKMKELNKTYYQDNKEKIKIRNKEYRKSNRNKINDYNLSRRKTDIQYKLNMSLRSRLNNALKRNQKSGSAVKDLGCSIDELKTYLESKFTPGMTWDNWSVDGWHIDHIKPLASFDLTDRKQLLEACHYTNLQPLWASDNLTKSDKII